MTGFGGPIKVAHVLTNLALGGPQGWTAACARLANTDLFEVHVVSGSSDGHMRSHEEHLRQAIGPRLHVLPELVRAIRPVQDAKALRQLIRLFERECFDLVHTHMSKAGTLGRMAARAAQRPLVVHTAHGWGLLDSKRAAVRQSIALAERASARWTDLLFVVCEHDRHVALERLRLKPELLADGRQGVALAPVPTAAQRRRARACLGIPDSGPVVGTVTRLVASKRVEDFVRAMPAVQRQVPGTTFVVMGSGPEEPRLRGLAADIGVRSVVWLPTSPLVADALRSFDVFVHPSDREGLPMVVMQAMSAHVPVVAEDAGGTREVIRSGETGILVPIGNHEHLGRGVVSILTNPGLAGRMTTGARKLIEDGHVELDRVRAIEQAYVRLIDSARPGELCLGARGHG